MSAKLGLYHRGEALADAAPVALCSAAFYAVAALEGGVWMGAVAQDIRRTGFAATERRDRWWVAPLVQGLLLAMLICYANWAAYQGNNYQVGGYLSPLYSPLIKVNWFPFSPAFLILL